MNISLRSTLALAALAASVIGQSALAGPIVQAGSSYDLRFFGTGISPTISVANITFDGVAETFTRTVGGVIRTLIVTETDTDLGAGQHLISVLLSADGDLFPGDQMAASTGNNNPFNLLSMVRLDRAVLTLGSVNGADLAYDFTGVVGFPNPWNGSAPVAGLGVGFTGTTVGLDTRSIKFDLYVSQIPEPGGLGLAGLALAALAALGLRRRARAV